MREYDVVGACRSLNTNLISKSEQKVAFTYTVGQDPPLNRLES